MSQSVRGSNDQFTSGRPSIAHTRSYESAQAKKLAHDAKRRRLSQPPPPPPGRQLVPVTRETPLDRNESLTVVRETYHRRRACVLFPRARKSVVFGVRVWNFRLEEMWYYTVDGQRDRPERVLLTEWLRSVSLNLDGSWIKGGVSVSWDSNDCFCYFVVIHVKKIL